MPAAVDIAEFYEYIKKPPDEDAAIVTRALNSATWAAERHVGPILIQDFTSRVKASGGALVLPKTPVTEVISVTGVYPPALTWAQADLVVDNPLAGTIVPLHLPFAKGIQSYDVIYKAGRATTLEEVPDNYAEAVCIIGKHLIEVRYGQAARPGLLNDTVSSGEAERRLPTGFAIPARARELLGIAPTVS